MVAVPAIPGALNVSPPLAGNELVSIGTRGPRSAQTTTAAIAALANGVSVAAVVTALATVGAGTITAAGIKGGVTARGGAQSGAAFTDTTDTAAAILALLPTAAPIGTAWFWTYRNNTNAPATLAGGVGVTVSGITVLPPNSWARYLVTYTAANTLTVVAVESGLAVSNRGQFTLTEATPVVVANANVTAFSSIIITLKTPGGTVGPVPAIQTITPGTGFTVAGTALDTSVYNYLILE